MPCPYTVNLPTSADLEADFGTDASIEVRKVGFDIQRAISLIRRLKVEQVKPDEV